MNLARHFSSQPKNGQVGVTSSVCSATDGRRPWEALGPGVMHRWPSWWDAFSLLCPFLPVMVREEVSGGADLTLMPLKYLLVSLCNREVTDLKPWASATPAWRPPSIEFIFHSHFLFLTASDICCPLPAAIKKKLPFQTTISFKKNESVSRKISGKQQYKI